MKPMTSSSTSRGVAAAHLHLHVSPTSTRRLYTLCTALRRRPPQLTFASHRRFSSRFASKEEHFFRRCTPTNSGPQSRHGPPIRDTGIANEKDWGISLVSEKVNESGTNEDGSFWYRESGEDLGENGYRCRWTRMGGRFHDGSSEWKETWWEKSDWSGFKELGVEKSGENAEGDSWWETWQEVLHQDEWRTMVPVKHAVM